MKFYFHFNKPASLREKQVKVSVHVGKTCYLVDNVICKVPTKGKINKRQPRFVMTGVCESFRIEDGVGIIE